MHKPDGFIVAKRWTHVDRTAQRWFGVNEDKGSAPREQTVEATLSRIRYRDDDA